MCELCEDVGVYNQPVAAIAEIERPDLAAVRDHAERADGPELRNAVALALRSYSLSTIVDQVIVGIRRRDLENADIAEMNSGGRMQ